MTTHIFRKIPVTSAQINACTYSKWSKYFTNNIPPAVVLSDVPSEFLDYLKSESIRLPLQNSDPVKATSDNEYSDWEGDEQPSENPVAAFADFHAQIEAAVAELGSVVVKLNWSAPKDAKWILAGNSLECTSAVDIYLLLSASDHTAHDLNGYIYEECEDKDVDKMNIEVVIKKYVRDFNPALEFRLFIHSGEIIGVSQRDINHYQFLETIQDKLRDTITRFHKSVLLNSKFPLRDYIMDAYIAHPYDKITILDINPFTRKWDLLLFTWLELLEKEPDGTFDLRIITESNLGAMARKDYGESQVPIEVVDALLNSDAMIELAREWQKSH